MRKLIAKRQIRYMGRTYERGEVIPANEPEMVAAWLRADSAAWAGDTQEAVAAAAQEIAERSRTNDLAAEAIRAMGVAIEDPAGEFVGVVRLKEQLRAIFDRGCEGSQSTPDGEGDASTAMLTGHLDAADLEKWKKADLEKLAAKMGVDISSAKNNAERAAILAAEEVLAPADDPGEDGGTQ